MKNKKLYLLLSFTFLTGCTFTNSSSNNSSINNTNSEEISISSLSSEESNSILSENNNITDSSIEVSEGSNEEISNSDKLSFSEELSTSEEDSISEESESESESESSLSEESSLEIDYYSIYLDGNYCSNVSGTYEAGNYGITRLGNYNYEFYRTGKASYGYLVKLLPAVNDMAIGGSFANYEGISDIDYITFSYYCESESTLYYGKTQDYSGSLTLPASNQISSYTFNLKAYEVNYFMIETTLSELDIESIEIKYSDQEIVYQTRFNESGYQLNRLNPVVYEGELVSGESQVNVPVSIEVTGETYVVKEYKTYTYYSPEAISMDESLADASTYTDPIDVANYFIAFKTWPCNYYPSTSNISRNYPLTKYEAQNIFGESYRSVSMYTRTTGYANYVPYAIGSGNVPHYYECDIDLDGSYFNDFGSYTRGTGRVIVWLDGYDENKGAKDYDDSPVAVYTDDHYTTFMEYYNNGTYSHRYNAIYSSIESCRTSYCYGAPKTLN